MTIDEIRKHANFIHGNGPCDESCQHLFALLRLYDAQAKELAIAKAAPKIAWLITSHDSSFDTFVKYSEPLDAKLIAWYPRGYSAKPLKVMP